MKTRITRLFGIEHPVLCAGMGYVAVPELVAAVSNAGGLGILATATLTPEQTRTSVQRVRELTDRPFAANVTLVYETAAANARVLMEERVPIINMSMGVSRPIIDEVHSYGGKTISTVVSERHARRAQKEGADALIVTGHEAAGHGGDVTSLVAIPLISRCVDIPVIAAGGFGDGRGLAAAIMLGADAVSMGTRFAGSVESPVHGKVKTHLLKAGAEDTIYTDRIDGWGNRFITTRRVAVMTEKRSLLQAFASIPKVKAALGLTWGEVLIAGLRGGPDIRKSLRQAQIAGDTYVGLKDGDFEKGVIPGGQIVGAVTSILPAREIIEQTVAEAEAVIRAKAAFCE